MQSNTMWRFGSPGFPSANTTSPGSARAKLDAAWGDKGAGGRITVGNRRTRPRIKARAGEIAFKHFGAYILGKANPTKSPEMAQLEKEFFHLAGDQGGR